MSQDQNPQQYKDYQYSPIRMKFAKTGEVFNIGVIVMDEFGANREIRTIDDFYEIADCLRIEEPSSHGFMLNYLHSEFRNDSFDFGKEFSNAMLTESPEWLYSNKTIPDAADELFDELITVTRTIKSEKHISDKTPKKIVTSLRKYAIKHEYKRIEFHKKLPGGFGKKVDTIVFAEDKMEIAVIGVDVCTTATEDFLQKVAFSTMSLLGAVNAKSLRHPMIYMPHHDDFTHVSMSDYGEAKQSVRSQRIAVNDSSDQAEFYGILQEKAVGFGTSLLR